MKFARMQPRRLRSLMPLARSWAAYGAMPLASLVTAPILARALGPEGRGQLAGLLQPLTLAGAVAAVGVPSAVTYFIGQGAPTRHVVRIAIRVAVAATLVVGAGLVIYSSSIADRLSIDRWAMLLIWSAFVPSALVSVRRAHLQGLRRYAALDLERLLAAGLRTGIIVALWLAGVRSVLVFAGAYMVAGLSASAAGLRLREAGVEPMPTDAHPITSRAFVGYSLLSSLGTIAAAMNARLDQAIMPAAVSAAELGYYSVAVAVAEIPAILTAVTVRNVLAETSGGFERRAILRTAAIGAGGQVLLIGALLVALPIAVPLAFGRDFGPAADLVRILLLGALMSYWTSVGSSYLSGFGRPGLGSVVQGVAGLVTGLLFWAWWHRLSAEVAAWTNVCSQGAALIAAIAFVAATRNSRASRTGMGGSRPDRNR